MNSAGLRGCPLITNTNAGAGDKPPNYVFHLPLLIAFVELNPCGIASFQDSPLIIPF